MYDTKIQTPIRATVLKKAKTRARDMGFSSVNDVIRILLKQFGEGNVNFLIAGNNTPIEFVDHKEQKELENILNSIPQKDRVIIDSKSIEL